MLPGHPTHLPSANQSVQVSDLFPSSTYFYLTPPCPLSSVPQTPFLTPIQQNGSYQAASSSKTDTCLCPKGSNRGVSSGHEQAQSKSWLDAEMACEMSWPTLLLFLEHTVTKDRYRYRYMAMDRSGYRGN